MLVLIVSLFLVGISEARIVTWDAPTTNADGTLLTDLAGFNLYCDGVKTDVKNVTSFTLPKPCQNAYVTAYDTSGNESEPSNVRDFMPPAGCKNFK